MRTVVFISEMDRAASLRQFGDNLRHLRTQRGLSQEQLADISSCHRNYIGALERGEKNVTLLKMLALAASLRCDLAELLVGVQLAFRD